MARLAALFFWVLAVATAVAFVVHPIWLPEVVSVHGVDVDREMDLTFVVAGAAFVLAHVFLGLFLWRYGGKSAGPAVYWHESRRMEITWTVITAVIFVGLGLQGSRIWARTYLTDPPANALAIEVTGEQFAWNIRYPGPDGKFGRTRPDKVDNSEGNYIGLDDADPASADDITTQNVIAVPINRPIKVIVRSMDVLHSFFVPVLRVKQDAVPGMGIPVQFTATKVGEYEVACAELCGMQHYKMRARFLVMSEPDFDAWLKARSAQ
jgi:cytochrome c oxidase subunit II